MHTGELRLQRKELRKEIKHLLVVYEK